MIRKLIAAGFVLGSVLATAAHAETINLTPDGSWYTFDVDSLTSQTSGLEWISLGDGSALHFTFTLAAPALLTVVDGGFAGDRFEVFDNGGSFGVTLPGVDTYPESLGLNFDAALADGRWSRGTVLLDAGTHDLTGLLFRSAEDDTGIPLDATVGALRVTAVPAPVPLPAAGLLFLGGSGLLGLFARRRRAV